MSARVWWIHCRPTFISFNMIWNSSTQTQFQFQSPHKWTSRNKSAIHLLPYIPTPGIDIGTFEVANVGTLCVWDCAGHIEYHVTHGMFLGSENAIGVVAYDIRNGIADIEVIMMLILWFDYLTFITIFQLSKFKFCKKKEKEKEK